MSVEQPLWRALTGYRVLTAGYAVALFVVGYEGHARPVLGMAFMALLVVWTLATLGKVSSPQRCTRGFLFVDLGIALTGILLTPVVELHQRIVDGGPTLPSIWTAGSVLAYAIKGGWRWAAAASCLVGGANMVERGALARDTVHNVLLVAIASIAIGYVVEVARASERTLARALQIEAATRERERLARDIHDNVLQVLAMVQRRGTEIGGEAEALGRMAGEQEAALRALVTVGAAALAGVPVPREGEPDPDAPRDLRVLLTPYGGARVTVAVPGTPVLLPGHAAPELAAAVGAALENVRKHAGERAHAWILVEDAPDAVLVSVRDDGPGIPEGRLADARAEGRLGVAQSIQGRLRDLGGTAELVSVPGQGTEVELRLGK
ncbi:MacS family sensor histidine kinase [Streptomyces sp. NPDC058691]|uniref:MacS family sensor histidine kinase n=1 Tax=Streptomyces sp. NPDC058691 TaxID=3346601 RepID=UPI00365F7A8D